MNFKCFFFIGFFLDLCRIFFKIKMLFVFFKFMLCFFFEGIRSYLSFMVYVYRCGLEINFNKNKNMLVELDVCFVRNE